MYKELNAVEILMDISENYDLNMFYHIAIQTASKQITFQGNFSDACTTFAKDLNVELNYDSDSRMLKGESVDKMIRIVLT